MRRSICLCDPPIAYAGEVNTWKFIYTTATTLPKGAKIRFDLGSKGRPIDWQIPKIDLKANSNIIFAFLPDGKPISAKPIVTPGKANPLFEFTLPSELKVGQSFTISVGASAKGDPKKNGNKTQTYSERRKPFHLYIAPKGDSHFEDPELFTLDVRGNKLHNIQILAPSFVVKNKRFDVVVRFEDEFGNLTGNAPEGTLIDFSHDHLRENLSWKLFIPETGFVTLPNLYFNDPGIYHIRLKNLKTGELFISAPVKCFQDTHHSLFWGLLHGESERIDSSESIESCLRHLRDEKSLNFFATSPFESAEETSNELWKLISQHVAEFHEDERFATFLGLQWVGEAGQEGVRHLIYLKDQRPLLRQKDPKTNSLKKIYKTFSPKELISIPSFMMAGGCHFDFEEHDPEFERVVEIYNAWGSSECLKSEGNPRPVTTSGKKGVKENKLGSIQAALQNNKRFGFVAGGLDDRGVYGGFFEGDQVQYSPGLTAIIAKDLTRGSLIEALYARSCYATTGARIVLGLHVAGASMGSELETKMRPGLVINRHISGFVAGTATLHKVWIIRNGEVLKLFDNLKNSSLDFAFDDLEDLSQVVMDGGAGKPPFVYYYLRVLQRDGQMAWSSPIWIDFHGEQKKNKKPVKKK